MRPSRVARGEAKRKHHRTCKICGKAPLNGARKEYCSWACYQRGKSEERVKDGRAKCAKCGEWKPLSECVRGVNGRPHSYCKPCVSVWFHERRGKPAEQRRPYRARYTLTEEEKALNRRLGSMLNKKRRAAAGPWPSAQELRQLVLAQESRCAYCLVELDRGFHFDHKLPIARGGTNSISNLQATCAKCNQTKHTMTHEEYLVSKKRKVTEWVQPISETTHE
jgi:5-methylcytosine-specific restriction endonuclease McrA